MNVHLLALHVACAACGASARLGAHDDAYQHATAPLSVFFGAHKAPAITHADLTINGAPRTVRTVTRQETP